MEKVKPVKNSHILLMKVGPYCGYSLKEIIKIKQGETKKCGKFFWGYGGVFCRPNVIHSFVAHAKHYKQKPLVLFTITQSSYQTPGKGKFTHFSLDKNKWLNLPEEVLLVGDKTKSHFAITAKNLKSIKKSIDLGEYCTFSGMFPDPNKYLDKYFRYRVDKACGFYLPKKSFSKKELIVGYSCELVEPYCVFIE
jgi:hypothetical protein